jgi:hypothetical protein
MKIYGGFVAMLGISITSCMPSTPDQQNATARSAIGSAAAAKTGKEQTDSPRYAADEPQFPQGAGTPLRPGPTIQFQPSDLTSSIEKSPLRVGIDNLGAPVGAALLNAVANAVRLYEWPEMRSVPFSYSVNDVTGGDHAADGYRRTGLAYVEVKPSVALGDRWYAMVLSALPSGVTLPSLASHELLPDGTIGARFSPGSHPTLASVRVCEKGAGQTVVIAQFSERVTHPRPADIAGVRLAPGVKSGAGCALDLASFGPEPARFVRSVCQGVALETTTAELALDGAIVSTSGRPLESPAKGVGPISIVLSAANMAGWGHGCKIIRP